MPTNLPIPRGSAPRSFTPADMSSYMQPTPQTKISNTGKRFGYPGIKNQQGSTRIIYDYLPFDGRTLFEFFNNVNTRQFPFTNLTENKLQVAESMVIQRMYLAVIITDAVTGDVVSSMELNQAGLSNIYRSDFNFTIANSQVLKPINVQSFQPQFNKSSNWGSLSTVFAGGVISNLTGNSVWHADTLLNIPPLIEFNFNMKTDGYTPVANMFIGLTVEGTGAIMAPRQTF